MRRALTLTAAIAGCDPGCGPPSRASVDAAQAPPTREVPARCVAEARAASVVFPPGSGDVHALSVACADGLLGAFIQRGHTLSWTARPVVTSAAFSSPIVVATAADRLGPVGHDAPQGPVAWRSPTAGLDDAPERDDLWAAVVQRADGGAAARVGDAILPAGYVGLGVPFVHVNPAGRFVTATVARENLPPSSVVVAVPSGGDEPSRPPEPLATRPGHIEAWEPRTDTTLARVSVDGGSFIEARRGGRAVGRAVVRAPELVVLPRGEETPAGAVFALGEFAVGRGDGGACVSQPGGLCLRPGRVVLLVVPTQGALRELLVAPRGVPDALAYDGDAVTVLYVEPDVGDTTAQRAARVDVRSGASERVALTPPEGFPAIDVPRLARCGSDLWLVAAVSLDARGARRTGVTALPLECVLR